MTTFSRWALVSVVAAAAVQSTGIGYVSYGMESARSAVHLARLFERADQAHLFRDPDEAAARMRRVMAVASVA